MSTGFATPDKTALSSRAGRTPPAMPAMTSESGVPSSTSANPACWTSPTTVAITTPGDSVVPSDRCHDAPRAMIGATLASVSTLVTSVGLLPGVSSSTVEPADQPTGGVLEKRPNT